MDIEASDIHAKAYPIEIGVLLPSGETYCSLIQPPKHWIHWDKRAEAIHGITREELYDNGKSVVEVAIALNDYLAEQTVYSDCWVLDYPWVIRLYEAAAMQPRFVLRDIMYRLSEEEYQALGDIKQTIRLQLNLKRHRATNDARVLQLAYYQIVTNRKVVAESMT